MFRRTNLAGARVVLTGASSGIGAALAEELAKTGARLALAARSGEKLKELVAKLPRPDEMLVLPTDVTEGEQRRRLIDETVRAFGGIDILVNNAGVGASGFFAEASESRLRSIFEVNFFAATELTRLAIPHLARGRDAMIVNVSSVIGRRAVPGYTEYCASKFALCGWSQALRAELVRQGIHVLLVCPGLIETPFRDNQLESNLSFQWQKRRAMSAQRCARIILQAMRKRLNEVVITWDGKLLVLMNRWFPGLVDYFMRRMIKARVAGEKVHWETWFRDAK